MKNMINDRIITLFAAMGLAVIVLVGCQRADSSAPAAASPEDGASGTAAPEVAAIVKAGDYTIDQAHSEIGFRVKHLGISTVRGVFSDAEATITFPADELTGLQAKATIPAASINTNDVDRDEHLRSGDFFDAENHPVIVFETTDVTAVDGNRLTLNGDLTIRGVTKPVALDGEFLGSAVDPWGNERVAFTAEGTINRKDFGLNWNKALEAGGLLVGDEVTIVLDVQAIKDVQ